MHPAIARSKLSLLLRSLPLLRSPAPISPPIPFSPHPHCSEIWAEPPRKQSTASPQRCSFFFLRPVRPWACRPPAKAHTEGSGKSSATLSCSVLLFGIAPTCGAAPIDNCRPSLRRPGGPQLLDFPTAGGPGSSAAPGGPSGCSCQPTEAPRPGFVPQPRRVAVRGAAVSPAQSFGVVDMNDELPMGGGEARRARPTGADAKRCRGRSGRPPSAPPRCPPQGCETNSVAHRAKRGTTAEVSYGDLWGRVGIMGTEHQSGAAQCVRVRYVQ